MTITKIKRVWLLGAVALSFFMGELRAQSPKDSLVRVGFLNCYNLFDTINDPALYDGDYTPEGRYGWDSEKYQTKTKALGKLLGGLNLDAMGLCEVENRKVVEDMLLYQRRNYHIIHYESSDSRGIDLAFVYDPKVVEVLESRLIASSAETLYKRREALHVRTQIKGEELSFVLVHLPSRRGGIKAKRDRAIILKGLQNEISSWDEDVVLMGDMNIAKAVELAPLENITRGLIRAGQGSYLYRGVWSMLDQALVSVGLMARVAEVALYSPSNLSHRANANFWQEASDHKPLVFVLNFTK